MSILKTTILAMFVLFTPSLYSVLPEPKYSIPTLATALGISATNAICAGIKGAWNEPKCYAKGYIGVKKAASAAVANILPSITATVAGTAVLFGLNANNCEYDIRGPLPIETAVLLGKVSVAASAGASAYHLTKGFQNGLWNYASGKDSRKYVSNRRECKVKLDYI